MMERQEYKVIREGKKHFVLVPQNEYDAILDEMEDLRDAIDFDRAMDKDEESFPADVVRRLVKEENPVRVYREHRGLKQNALAKKAGIGIPYLSDIENGKKTGSLKTLKKIAKALEVGVDDLIE